MHITVELLAALPIASASPASLLDSSPVARDSGGGAPTTFAAPLSAPPSPSASAASLGALLYPRHLDYSFAPSLLSAEGLSPTNTMQDEADLEHEHSIGYTALGAPTWPALSLPPTVNCFDAVGPWFVLLLGIIAMVTGTYFTIRSHLTGEEP